MATQPQINQRYNDQIFRAVKFTPDTLESASFYSCKFVQCHFPGSSFLECRFVDVLFKECDLSLFSGHGSLFSGCRFEQSKLIGVDWTTLDWEAITIRKPITFDGCDISHSSFLGLTLSQVQITDCLAKDVDFREANLSETTFSGTDLSESTYGATNLTGADFRGARNYHIDPTANIITGAKFTLPEALGLLYALDLEIEG